MTVICVYLQKRFYCTAISSPRKVSKALMKSGSQYVEKVDQGVGLTSVVEFVVGV